MELKPRSIKLVDFKEELLPSGRKLLHCIFEDRHGNSRFRYRWTAPWRDKEGEHGIEKLFLKSLEIEEWNDFDGVWSEELRKVSKEVPSLEEMELPVRIKIGEISEVFTADEEGIHEYWRIGINILSGEALVRKYREYGKDYIRIGDVSMSWDSLQYELYSVKGIDFFSEGIQEMWEGDSPTDAVEVGVCFSVWVKKAVERTQYQVISKEIASRIRHFIRSRLSEYKAIKKGFEEEG